MPYDLKTALGSVKAQPKNFFLYTGTKGSQVLIGSSSSPISSQVAETHTKVGNTAKPVLTGVCFRDPEGGVVIFATKAEPPAGKRDLILKSMKAGSCVVAFELRKMDDGETSQVDGEASLEGEKSKSESSSEEEGTQSSESGSGEKKRIQPVIRKPMMATSRMQRQNDGQPKPTVDQGGGQSLPRQTQPTVGQGGQPLPRQTQPTVGNAQPNVGQPQRAFNPAKAKSDQGDARFGQARTRVQPQGNVQPQPTGQPQVDVQPQPTGQPRVNVQPQPTGQPRVNVQPQPTGQPRVNVQPQPTGQPRVNVQPQPTGQPRVNVQPQPTGQPQVDVQPQPTGQPQVDVQPQPTGRPQVNVQPQPTSQPQVDVQPQPTIQAQPTVQPPVRPQSAVPRDPAIMVKPSKLRRVEAGKLPVQKEVLVNPAGQKTVTDRANSTIQHVKGLAASVAQSSFPQGSADTAMEELDQNPVSVDRGALAQLTVDIEGYYQKLLNKEGISDNQKRDRIATVKAEKDAAAKMAQVMKDFEESATADQDLVALEQECQKSINVYEKRFVGRLKNIDQSLVTSPGSGSVLLAEKKDLLEGPQGARLAASYDLLFELNLQKNAQLVQDLQAALAEAEKSKTEANLVKVQTLAARHRKVFEDHAANYEKVPGQVRPPAVLAQQAVVDDLLEQADKTLFSLKQEKLGSPPWTGPKRRLGSDLVDQGREILAKDLFRNGTKGRPAGGSSDVIVLKNSNDQVEFAFKTAKGESSQMDLPPGGGAIREAVTSKVVDAVLEQTGFDFGFPKSSIATIDGKVGALIEGVRGRELPAHDKIKEEDKKEIAEFQNKIPGKQLQKTICAGLLTGNFADLKWDNVFWEGEGKTANARPFDAGAAFLPTNAIQKQLFDRIGGDPGFDVPLLFDANGKHTKGAKEKMDKEIIATMLKIDLVAMQKTIEEEVQRQASTGLDKCLDVESMKNGLKCLQLTQNILRHYLEKKKRRPTLVELMAAMEKLMLHEYKTTS